MCAPSSKRGIFSIGRGKGGKGAIAEERGCVPVHVCAASGMEVVKESRGQV